jgi:O-succinylhomoserine sulfhydrylase
VKIAIISNNLGDSKTFLTHPATTTHQRLPQAQKDLLGITDGLVRISIGIEDTDDLIADIKQALEVAK